MSEEEYQKWFERQVDRAVSTQLVKAGTLEKYLFDPAAADRFVNSAAAGETFFSRVSYYPGEKYIDPQEFAASGYAFFHRENQSWAADYRERLVGPIEEKKVDSYLSAIRQLWVDGYQKRQHDPLFVSLKESIRQHDKHYYPHRNVFVEERCPKDAEPLFDPHEMHLLFEVTSSLSDVLLADYLESREDHLENSLGRVFLHRGVFPPRPIMDSVWVEKNYLTSYTLAVSVAEVFAQTWQGSKPDVGSPTIVSSRFSNFNNRILAFAPLVPGMTKGQLEILAAPPLQAFALKSQGVFDSDSITISELEFDQVDAGLERTLVIPERVLRPSQAA